MSGRWTTPKIWTNIHLRDKLNDVKDTMTFHGKSLRKLGIKPRYNAKNPSDLNVWKQKATKKWKCTSLIAIDCIDLKQFLKIICLQEWGDTVHLRELWYAVLGQIVGQEILIQERRLSWTHLCQSKWVWITWQGSLATGGSIRTGKYPNFKGKNVGLAAGFYHQ